MRHVALFTVLYTLRVGEQLICNGAVNLQWISKKTSFGSFGFGGQHHSVFSGVCIGKQLEWTLVCRSSVAIRYCSISQWDENALRLSDVPRSASSASRKRSPTNIATKLRQNFFGGQPHCTSVMESAYVMATMSTTYVCWPPKR